MSVAALRSRGQSSLARSRSEQPTPRCSCADVAALRPEWLYGASAVEARIAMVRGIGKPD